MENPASWTEVELTIDRAITRHRRAQERGVIGGSEAMAVATALREAGHIAPYDPSHAVGWDRLREAREEDKENTHGE